MTALRTALLTAGVLVVVLVIAGRWFLAGSSFEAATRADPAPPASASPARADVHAPPERSGPRSGRFTVPEGPDGELRLDLPAPARGRVLGSDGEPVEGARVVASRMDGDGESHATHTDADGAYELDELAGGRWRLSAWRAAVGLAKHDGPIAVPAAGPFDLPDLVLRSAGELSGVVALPNGEPAAELRLYAIRADGTEDWKRGVKNAVLGGPVSDDGLIRGRRGIPGGVATTDARGRFRIGGLEPGPYVFALEGTTSAVLEESHRGPHFTDARDLRIEVTWHVLNVRAEDPRGELVEDARLGLTHGDLSAAQRDAIRQADYYENDESGGWTRGVHIGSERTYEVTPGETVRVDAGAPGFEPAFGVIDVRADEYHYDLRLVLRPSAARDPGTLRVSVPAGLDAAAPLYVGLISRETGIGRGRWLSDDALVAGGEVLALELPAGPYRLQARPHGGDYLPSGDAVVVAPGDESHSLLVLERGGRVRFDLRFPDALVGQPVGRIGFEMGPLGEDPTFRNTLFFAEAGAVESFEPRAQRPGTYAYAFEGAGFAPVAGEVVIEAAGTTRVEVVLE